MWLRFRDGTAGEIDLSPALRGPIFEPLRDPYVFRRFVIHPEFHTLVWPNGASRIVQGIQRAAFVIADVTFSSVNVYYELGFAEALGKDVLVIPKEGTALPFDTNDIPTLFFKDQTRLEDALRARIGRLTGRQLRATN